MAPLTVLSHGQPCKPFSGPSIEPSVALRKVMSLQPGRVYSHFLFVRYETGLVGEEEDEVDGVKRRVYPNLAVVRFEYQGVYYLMQSGMWVDTMRTLGNVSVVFRCWPDRTDLVTEPSWERSEADAFFRRALGTGERRRFVPNFAPRMGSAYCQNLFKRRWSWLLYDPRAAMDYVIETFSSACPRTAQVPRLIGGGFLDYNRVRDYAGVCSPPLGARRQHIFRHLHLECHAELGFVNALEVEYKHFSAGARMRAEEEDPLFDIEVEDPFPDGTLNRVCFTEQGEFAFCGGLRTG